MPSERVGKVPESLYDRSLLDREEVVAGDERRETEARGGPVGGMRIDVHVARITLSPKVPRNHGDDSLADPLVVSIVLHDYGGPDLGMAGVGEREIDDDNVPSLHHGLLPYFCW
jgi:hypothetical protein